MTVYVGLLRAVNVGGTGKLPMSRLVELCTGLGFGDVRTYIQSGNVVFDTTEPVDAVRAKLEDALTTELGRPADVVLRTADELADIAAANPFPEADGAKVAVVLGHSPVPADLAVTAPGGEQVVPGDRELFVYYPDGMGRSKLKLPALAGPVTVRNMNTVTKLVALAQHPS